MRPARPALAAIAFALAHSVAALDATQPALRAFVEQVSTQHGLEAAWVSALLDEAVAQPKVVEAIRRPAERVRPWHEYREIFLTEERIAAGVEFWRAHCDELRQAEHHYGVPAEVIVGILGVETFYGRIAGSYRVLDALATLAFDYPPRGAFFRGELEQFLLLAHDGALDPRTALGSYAGAMGLPQFIPSSFRNYSVDSDGDGRRDLWNDHADVFGSIANYLSEHRWADGAEVVAPATLATPQAAELSVTEARLDRTAGELRAAGVQFGGDQPDAARAALLRYEGRDGPEYWVGFNNFYAITRYNRSTMYALAVHQLGAAIAARLADMPAAE